MPPSSSPPSSRPTPAREGAHRSTPTTTQGDDTMKMNRRNALQGAATLALATTVPLAFGQKKITLGFSQIGAESEWRTANSESVKSAAKDAGIALKFSDAQAKQENQL